MQNHNPQATTNALGKRKAVGADVEEVAPPTKVPAAAPAAADELDDDLQYIGRSGHMALQDFPHARENCTVKPFDPTNEDKCYESCPNCYCYVCDTPVSACTEWDDHCMARHDLPRWQHARAAAKAVAHAKGTADVQQPQQPAASRQRAMLLGPDELLSAVESVHPVETPEPAGLRADVRLRPYQKQSLAFALELERADDSSLLGREGSVRGGFICDEMGMGKTAVCTALVLARPFSETTTTTTTPRLPLLPAVRRDAWGSASAPAPLPIKHEASGAASSSSSSSALRKLKGRRLKTTLVVAPNTLIGQWHDEVRAFAPSLVTRVLYGAAGKQVTAENIGEIDLLITTPHTKLPVGVAPDALVFHRLIVDESHLLDAGRGAASAWGPAQLQALLSVQAPHVWLVTGTPFVLEGGSLTFENQLRLLGHHGEGLRLGGRALTDEAVPDIQRLMIRHSKAQRIHGEAALSLPDADVQTTMLELTPDERALYDLAACADGLPDWLHAQYPRPWVDEKRANLGRGVERRLRACACAFDNPAARDETRGGLGAVLARAESSRERRAGAGKSVAELVYDRVHGVRAMEKSRKRAELTKFAALLRELGALLVADPLTRVVVFTQFDGVQQALVQMLMREAPAFTIFSLNKHTPVGARHRLIREFQSRGNGGRAAVCVATYHTAAVGITLTAASKVILMEPAMDPALEAQAAGRIHRLGQTKEVLIRRFAFSGTVEASILALHAALKAGTLTKRELQDCGGARSVTRNADVAPLPAAVREAFSAHGVAEPHRLVPVEEVEARKQTDARRYDETTGKRNEVVWEWFSVKRCRCADCGAEVDGEGRCTFRGLASERAARAQAIERAEARLERVGVLKAKAQRGKQLTELQAAAVEDEEETRRQLERLRQQVDEHGVGWFTHPPGSGGGRSGAADSDSDDGAPMDYESDGY